MLRFPRGHAVFTCGMQPGARSSASSSWAARATSIWCTPGIPPPDRPSELVLETSARLETTAAERIEFQPVNQYAILAQLFARAAATQRPGADPARGIDQEHDRARRASPLGRERALGDGLTGAWADVYWSSSRLPMLTTASSPKPSRA